MYQFSSAVIVQADGKLVMQRKDEGAPVSPMMLSLFGGKIEHGETPEEAIIRELGEETSIKVSDINVKLIFSMDLSIEKKYAHPRSKGHVFELKIDKPDFDVYEGAGWEAYELKELLERNDVDLLVRLILEELERIKYGS